MGGNVYVTRSEMLRKEGREEGIKGLIDAMLDMKCSESDIISRLMKSFSLSEEEAKAHYDEYVGNHAMA